MRPAKASLQHIVFGMGVVAALGFGATTAAASVPSGTVKRFCPYYTSSAAVCAQKCLEHGYTEWAWNSSNLCCECYL